MSSLPTLKVVPQPRAAVRLIRGDCLQVMPKLKAKSVAMIFADLPYGLVRREWDKCLELKKIWLSFLAVGRINARYAFTAVMPFASDIICSNRKMFRYDVVWDKTRTTGFLNAKQRPLRRHEHVLIFARGKGTYNPQKTIGMPYRVKSRGRADLNYMANVDNNQLCVSNGERYPTSILSVPSSTIGSLHPTQKPVALLEWLIKTYTNPGDTILDPTAGSMTTAIAAMRTGRDVICIERDHAYFDAGVARVRAERARLDAGEG